MAPKASGYIRIGKGMWLSVNSEALALALELAEKRATLEEAEKELEKIIAAPEFFLKVLIHYEVIGVDAEGKLYISERGGEADA